MRQDYTDLTFCVLMTFGNKRFSINCVVFVSLECDKPIELDSIGALSSR